MLAEFHDFHGWDAKNRSDISGISDREKANRKHGNALNNGCNARYGRIEKRIRVILPVCERSTDLGSHEGVQQIAERDECVENGINGIQGSLQGLKG